MHTNAVLKSDANYLTREHQSVCWKGEWFDTYRYCSKSESCIGNSLRQWGNSFPAMWVRKKTKQKLFGQASIGTHAYMKHQTNLDAHHLAVSMYMYEYISKVMKTEQTSGGQDYTTQQQKISPPSIKQTRLETRDPASSSHLYSHKTTNDPNTKQLHLSRLKQMCTRNKPHRGAMVV
jgi:hypothetical protein